ncbi:hypothetical protein U1Q18_041442 [Sarracenia purpurea var. burkii]
MRLVEQAVPALGFPPIRARLKLPLLEIVKTRTRKEFRRRRRNLRTRIVKACIQCFDQQWKAGFSWLLIEGSSSDWRLARALEVVFIGVAEKKLKEEITGGGLVCDVAGEEDGSVFGNLRKVLR